MNLTGYHYLSSMPLSVDTNECLVSYKKRVSDGAPCPLLSEIFFSFYTFIVYLAVTCSRPCFSFLFHNRLLKQMIYLLLTCELT